MLNKTKAAWLGRSSHTTKIMKQNITLVDLVNLNGNSRFGVSRNLDIPPQNGITAPLARFDMGGRAPLAHTPSSQLSGDQIFGSIPRLSSSRLNSRLIQPALLSSPSSFIATARRSDNSGSRRSCTTCLSFWLSLVDIGTHRYIVCLMIANVHHCIAISKAKPGSVGALTGPLTEPLTGVTVMADIQSTQTHPKFTWRFIAVSANTPDARPIVLYINGSSESEVRSRLNDWQLFFAARLPFQEVSHG